MVNTVAQSAGRLPGGDLGHGPDHGGEEGEGLGRPRPRRAQAQAAGEQAGQGFRYHLPHDVEHQVPHTPADTDHQSTNNTNNKVIY